MRFLSHSAFWALLTDKYAKRLISRTGTERPPVCSLSCDRSLHSGTSICRHQTPPQYRHVIRRSCNTFSRHLSASRPLRPNTTSSIKLELHNVVQRRRRRSEPRPQGFCIQNLVEIGPAVPKICSRTDRHAGRQTG